jgi:Phosphodiester glycosidase
MGVLRRPVLVPAALALVAGLAATLPATASGARRVSSHIAPGVVYTRIVDPRGPWRVKVISIAPDSPARIDVALSNDRLPGLETTSSMARRNGALAAVDGDYARPSGRPVYTFARNGWLAQSTPSWGRSFALGPDRFGHVGHGALSVTATDATTGSTLRVDRFNQGRPALRQVAAFTPAGGRLERPPRFACSVRLRPLRGPLAGLEGAGLITEVEARRCGARPLARRGGIVLATPFYGPRAAAVQALAVGHEVTLSWSLGWPRVLDVVGGNPTLVQGGRVVVPRGTSAFDRRHPRTGVGVTPGGRVLLVIVDGRRPGYSVGLTTRGFARLFVSLGAERALNLDGGGSTTMYVRGRVVNRPSDGAERPVSSALLVLPPRSRASSGHSYAPGVRAPSSTAAKVVAAMARDAGSVGGLADSLARRNQLPAALRSAARAFHSR